MTDITEAKMQAKDTIEANGCYGRNACPCCVSERSVLRLVALVEKLERERDEARAEVTSD